MTSSTWERSAWVTKEWYQWLRQQLSRSPSEGAVYRSGQKGSRQWETRGGTRWTLPWRSGPCVWCQCGFSPSGPGGLAQGLRYINPVLHSTTQFYKVLNSIKPICKIWWGCCLEIWFMVKVINSAGNSLTKIGVSFNFGIIIFFGEQVNFYFSLSAGWQLMYLLM